MSISEIRGPRDSTFYRIGDTLLAIQVPNVQDQIDRWSFWWIFDNDLERTLGNLFAVHGQDFGFEDWEDFQPEISNWVTKIENAPHLSVRRRNSMRELIKDILEVTAQQAIDRNFERDWVTDNEIPQAPVVAYYDVSPTEPLSDGMAGVTEVLMVLGHYSMK